MSYCHGCADSAINIDQLDQIIADLREQLAGKAITQAHSLALDTIDRLQDERDSLQNQLQQTQDVARELLAALGGVKLSDIISRIKIGYLDQGYFDKDVRRLYAMADCLDRAQALLGSEGKAEAPLADTQPSGNK